MPCRSGQGTSAELGERLARSSARVAATATNEEMVAAGGAGSFLEGWEDYRFGVIFKAVSHEEGIWVDGDWGRVGGVRLHCFYPFIVMPGLSGVRWPF